VHAAVASRDGGVCISRRKRRTRRAGGAARGVQ
jgi:hypothetical protein